MTELRPPIFISSVMEGYGDIRDAASDGIRQAGCEPVRAEDFSAASASPRNACLDGVRSTDALVLLLGARYGFVGPSALAVTEEEYNEGRKNHKQIFVFLQDGVSRELQQQAFADRVQHYVDGHWRKVFDDPADLRELVRGAVAAADLARVPGHRAKAETRIRSTLNRRPPEAQDIVWLQSRLRNSWGWRLGAVLNSPGKHPFALDRRLDAGSGGPAARREVEVGLFRRVADRASEHRWVTDAGRAPRGVAGGALVMSPGVRAGRR